MAETEVAEVSSSTDAVITPCTTAEDFLVSSQNEALVEAVSSITSSDMGHVVLAPQPHIVQDNQVVTSGIQQVASSAMDHVIIGPDGQLSVGAGGEVKQLLMGSGQDQTYATAEADQIVMGQSNVAMPSSSNISTVSLDNSTLQGLLAAGHGTTTHLATANGETIQIIAVPSQSDPTGSGKFWQQVQMLPGSDMAAFIAVNQHEGADETHEQTAGQVFEQLEAGDVAASSSTQVVDMVPVSTMPDISVSSLISSPCTMPLPPGCPPWAARLKDCENIGDSYRGWVENEVELDLLLTYHKQQTQSFWGTRQSPSPAKQSTRLMWKSQYVPFDGIPFVNAGSRAVVMECQYGPRRKGAQAKRQGEVTQTVQNGVSEFKQTCPARIYIKKVRKYPEFAVDVNMDKKCLKMAMDKAFEMLKKKGTGGWGQERFYVQLPTEKAHEFHAENSDIGKVEGPCRLHPRVAQKIREVVAGGETRLYAVRKALRRFVEKQLFESAEAVPEKHNLNYYPTVNDLQNHIHQALKDISVGSLPVTAHTVNVEVMTSDSSSDGLQSTLPWQTPAPSDPHAETVTVTLTQNPGEDGQHVISRVETHMSDGSTQISGSLTPETAQLLSKLHPNMFPAGSLVQLQQQQSLNSAVTSGMGQEQTITVTTAPPVITEHQQQTIASVADTDMLNVAAGDDHDEDIATIDTGQGGCPAALIAADDGHGLVGPGMATLQIVQSDAGGGQLHMQAIDGCDDSQAGSRLVTVTMGADGCLTLLDGTTLATVTPEMANLGQVKMEEETIAQ